MNSLTRCIGRLVECNGSGGVVLLNQPSPILGRCVNVTLGLGHNFKPNDPIVVVHWHQRSYIKIDGVSAPVDQLCVSHCRPNGEELASPLTVANGSVRGE